MEPITKKDVLQMTGTIVAGILSNPASGIQAHDQYGQQQVIEQTFQNVISSFSSIGLTIEEEKSV